MIQLSLTHLDMKTYGRKRFLFSHQISIGSANVENSYSCLAGLVNISQSFLFYHFSVQNRPEDDGSCWIQGKSSHVPPVNSPTLPLCRELHVHVKAALSWVNPGVGWGQYSPVICQYLFAFLYAFTEHDERGERLEKIVCERLFFYLVIHGLISPGWF
jgi:hypothetical protein